MKTRVVLGVLADGLRGNAIPATVGEDTLAVKSVCVQCAGSLSLCVCYCGVVK